MPLVRLTNAERDELRRIARTTRDARVLRRALTLLDLALGESVDRVQQRYQIGRSTVYNWAARFRETGPSEAALRTRPHPGRPRRADGAPTE